MDEYIEKNITDKYNVNFVYRYAEKELDHYWTFAPITYEKAVEFTSLATHLYYEPFAEATSRAFMWEFAPKILVLLGSYGYNTGSNIWTAGYAPANGVKIVIARLNTLDTSGLRNEDDVARKAALDELNLSIVRTLYHETAHTLHQKTPYPKAYGDLSAKDYKASEQYTYWQDINGNSDKNKAGYVPDTPSFLYAGFISAYGSTNSDEDFAELFAHYIIYTDADWEQLYINANGKNDPDDTLTGAEILKQKVEIMKQFVKDNYNINIDDFRNAVHRRYPNIKDKDFTKLN